MSTDLIVEDGTGRTDANAFVSLEFFARYCQERGRSLTPYTQTEHCQSIIRATEYLSESFHWKGIRKNGRNDSDGYQALAWPRYGLYDRENNWVSSDSIPREIQWATCEAAYYELANPDALQPAYTPHDRPKMLKAGSVAITYDTSRKDAWGARPTLLILQDLVGEFLSSSGGNLRSGRTSRI